MSNRKLKESDLTSIVTRVSEKFPQGAQNHELLRFLSNFYTFHKPLIIWTFWEQIIKDDKLFSLFKNQSFSLEEFRNTLRRTPFHGHAPSFVRNNSKERRRWERFLYYCFCTTAHQNT